MSLQVNVSNIGHRVNAYVNVSGAGKQAPQVYINVSGTGRPLFSYSGTIGDGGGCSVSCGGGTQTRSVTCTRNDGETVADSLCTKFVGTKPVTSQACNTHACFQRCCCRTQMFRYFRNALPCTSDTFGNPTPNNTGEHVSCINGGWNSCSGGYAYGIGAGSGSDGNNNGQGLSQQDNLKRTGACAVQYYWAYDVAAGQACTLCSSFAC